MNNTTAKRITSFYQQEARWEEKIPYARFVDDETIETKNGNLLQIIKIKGIDAASMEDEAIEFEKKMRNSLLISLTDSTIAWHFHTIRKKTLITLDAAYKNDFLQHLQQKWQTKLKNTDFYLNEHYLTIIKKPPVGKIRRLSDFINSFKGAFVKAERERYRQETIKKLYKASDQVLTQFAHYGAIRLRNHVGVDKNGKVSESLSFLAYLLNLEQKELSASEKDISHYLAFKRSFFDSASGVLALRGVNQEVCYAGILSIKNYNHISYAGILDKILNLKCELIISQVFCPLDKEVSRKKIKEIQRNQAQSDDGQKTAAEQMTHTLDVLGNEEATLGEHQLIILCHSANEKILDKKMAEIDTVLNQLGIISAREDVGLQPAFFAMLPGNFAYLTRKALIDSKNMAGFASFHNHTLGKARDNFWGDAVTVLEARGSSPYFFNFHVMDVGNTFLIGPMGSGKTLLESFLLAQSMRFGGRLVVFDKDRGMEIFIRAIGGQYSDLQMGKKTGFAPFQLEDTPDNRFFIFKLLRKMAEISGLTIDADIEEILHFAIKGAYNLPRSERILRHIVPFLGMKKSGTLRSAFENWVNEGAYAWVFDNNTETFSLNSEILGFDLTSVLEDQLVSSVIYEYLFHRVESLLDGSKLRIVVSEGWRALQDASFREKIRDWSSTPRKKNAFLIMDTQSPSDIAQSEIACKIIQETVTQIYFANPSAEYKDYVEQFKLNEKEYQIIKSLTKSSRFFLLKQGEQSVVVRADLSDGFWEEIQILSGRQKNVRLLDQIRGEVGDDPKDWMPVFLAKVKAMEVENEKISS